MPHHQTREAPAFYNDLAASLAEGWQMLAAGADDPAHAMHTVAVATVARAGLPQVRTVVLRPVDRAQRQVHFHTDLRSPKIADLTASNAIQVLAFDPGRKVQLRLSGRAVIHHGDSVWERAWQAAHRNSRLCYGQADAPGTALSAPDDAPAVDAGKGNFAVISVSVAAFDWLYLTDAGHRRARFAWNDHGTLSAAWIAP